MLFNNGDSCWQGPRRSLSVTLKCGLNHKLTQLEEPSTCVYTAILETPVACSQAVAAALFAEVGN